MSEQWIARIGLCAAVAVLAACLGVLIMQGHSDAATLHSLPPAQIQSNS